MVGHGVKAAWVELYGRAQLLEPGSRAALKTLSDAAEKLPKSESAALAGLLGNHLENRLLIEADQKANPAIACETIEQPIIIIGMPRSGTSLLHALLATDPNNRAPRSWELMTPSPPAPDAAEKARRMTRSAEAVRAFIMATPGILKMHPYWDEAGETAIECEDVMQLSLISPYFPAFFGLPDYDRWLAAANHGPAYRAHRAFLQQLQWRAPRRRWVLKGVAHLGHLDLLLDTYPDACLVWPHRDPVEQIASMCALVAVTRRVDDPHSLNEIYRYLAANMARGLQAAQGHPAARDGRILHIPYASLNHKPMETVAAIYAQLGATLSPGHEKAMAAWLSGPRNDPNRHGRVSSSLARFGVSVGEVREMFADYTSSDLIQGLHD